MRWLTWALLLALLAAAVALLLQVNAGNVAFYLPPYRLDVSLNLFLLLLGGLLLLVYWTARTLQKLADFPDQVRLYRTRREEAGGQQALVEAVRSLLEGRFARAEKAARAAQASTRTAGVAALVGARAAHRMQEFERRDDWLGRAEAARDAETARLVTSAEMWSEQRDNDAALGAIERLQASGARHIHAMRIALNANLQSGRWDEALKALRALDKRKALHPVLARKLKLIAYREQLQAQRYDPASLEAAWDAVPAADRALPEVALEGARLLNLSGRGGRAAGAIEQALARPRADWDDSCAQLLDEYARAQSFPGRGQLERVEQWLAESPPADALRPTLLRAAGLLCLREHLWGKAKSYLADSLQSQRRPATLVALGRLAEAVGDDAEAAQHYRDAALSYAQLQPIAGDAARPPLREHTL
jgi:HemY protein